MRVFAAFVAILFCLVGASIRAEEGVPNIGLDDLKKAIDEKKVVLIDCNGTDSFKAGHIPGAIDYDGSGAELVKKLPADKSALIVSYCGSEHCGRYKLGAKAAEEAGYTNVKHFAAGIKGWKQAGEKTEAGS